MANEIAIVVSGKNKTGPLFAGINKQTKGLEKSFDQVGGAAKRLGDDTDRSFDRVGAGARKAVKASKGLGNTLSGVQDTTQGVAQIMKGDLLGGAISLHSGFTDLAAGTARFATTVASAVASFVASTATMVATHVSAVATVVAGWVMMGVQAMINAVKMAAAWLISLGPIGLVVAAIAGVIAILVALGVGFDDVQRAAAAVWGWIQANWPLLLAILTGPVGLAVLAIVRNWDTIKATAANVISAVAGFFAALPGRIAGAVARVGTMIKNALTAAKDWVRDRANDIVSFIRGIPGRLGDIGGRIKDAILGGLGDIAGAILDKLPSPGGGVPFIPGIAHGGVVGGISRAQGGGPRGGRTLVGEHGPEILDLAPGSRVHSNSDTRRMLAGGAGTVNNVHFHIAGSIRSDRDLMKLVRDELSNGGLR